MTVLLATIGAVLLVVGFVVHDVRNERRKQNGERSTSEGLGISLVGGIFLIAASI